MDFMLYISFFILMTKLYETNSGNCTDNSTLVPITKFTESPSTSEPSMLNISSTESVDSTLTTPFKEIEHSNKSSTTNISETTFIVVTNGYTFRCQGIMEMGDEVMYL
ncbi:uncharacterized protein LOC111632992 [Centruroides sculpturatus]|uniref:uncharacterized protein LOC111632992 n=1 Tax=Centruroides sculpturatus TaxID=218467 RepID=UPI000C6CA528|nr:uncharacterized protein LOC111632992 [Centruroides sculpturatus]